MLPPMLLLGGWLLWGESFLSVTSRVKADTLIVEGWIGRESLPVAKEEFERGNYVRMVITGGLGGATWSKNRWSLTERAEKDLLKLGFPAEKLVLAPSEDVDNQRTYEYALAASRTIERKGLHPAAINVISRGAHARRTLLVYRKVFGPATKVGSISWDPYASPVQPWWRSSTRAKEFLDESFGFSYEALLSSGRPDRTLASHLVCGALIGIAIFLFRRRRLRRKANGPAAAYAGPSLDTLPRTE